jgi:hypothetical protein
MWRKDLTAIVVAGLVTNGCATIGHDAHQTIKVTSDHAQTPAVDGLRSNWQHVLDLKKGTPVLIDLRNGFVVQGRPGQFQGADLRRIRECDD